MSVLVSFPPSPFATACAFPACSLDRMLLGRMFPFQSRRLSSPMSRIFCAPTDGPLTMACELPMLATSRTTKYEKPLITRTATAARQVTAYHTPVNRRRDGRLASGLLRVPVRDFGRRDGGRLPPSWPPVPRFDAVRLRTRFPSGAGLLVLPRRLPSLLHQ